MKKIVISIFFVTAFTGLQAMTSIENRRLITSEPLLFKQNNYLQEQISIEFEPLISGSFDPEHIIGNLTPQGKSSLILDQQGFGDINPELLLLSSSNGDRNYYSNITLTPEMQLYGTLFHCFKQFEYAFFDVRTSLLKCKTHINLTETGGDNGSLSAVNNQIIYSAYDAFTQADWKYGKIGASNELIGFDNIQLLIGGSTHSLKFENGKSFFAGFAVIEIPTGAGSTAEWMFEPQVGTNHWGLGLGFDCMVCNENNDFTFVFGGNFRHLIANWEKRSFSLTNNGEWSSYLAVAKLDTLQLLGGAGGVVNGLPGINLFTQNALIEGRNQITVYGRVEKKFEECCFEISYNFFYNQQETINLISAITPGYGIYAVGTDGGITTASTATISQATPALDTTPVELVTSDLNLASGAAGMWMSNTIAARLKRTQEFYTYGIGASVDLAQTSQAMSTWSVWANFEILLP